MTSTTTQFAAAHDQTAYPTGHQNPYAARFTLLTEEDSVEKWIGFTAAASRINDGFEPNATNEQIEQASIDGIRHLLISNFALIVESRNVGKPSPEKFATAYTTLEKMVANTLNGEDSHEKTVLQNPKFAVPTVSEIAAALDGVWVHTAALNEYAANISSAAEVAADSALTKEGGPA